MARRARKQPNRKGRRTQVRASAVNDPTAVRLATPRARFMRGGRWQWQRRLVGEQRDEPRQRGRLCRLRRLARWLRGEQVVAWLGGLPSGRHATRGLAGSQAERAALALSVKPAAGRWAEQASSGGGKVERERAAGGWRATQWQKDLIST